MAKTARFLFNDGRQHDRAFLTQLGSLRDVAQPMEVDVGAGHH